jgi:hypothetical protein
MNAGDHGSGRAGGHIRLSALLAIGVPTAAAFWMLAPNCLAATNADPFGKLAIYDGTWTVHASHPWSGGQAGSADQLVSRCHRFVAYFACEQTINGAPASLIVYTASDEPERLNTRTITPSGLAGGRGDLTLAGPHWTYIDRPPASLKGDWSRTENIVTDRDHIHFEEYASSDEGKSWRLTNEGEEVRRSSR